MGAADAALINDFQLLQAMVCPKLRQYITERRKIIAKLSSNNLTCVMEKLSLSSKCADSSVLLDASMKKKKLLMTAGTLALTAANATSLIFAAGDNPFDDIAKTISSLFKQFYEASSGIITVIAIVLIFICLVLRMISKDQRKVDAATEWLKRIIITWFIFMFLGNIQKIFTTISSTATSITWGS